MLKNREINVVIPMAGRGARFAEQGYKLPKPFIDVDGKMMIEHVLESLRLKGARMVLVIHRDFMINNELQLNRLQDSYEVEFLSVDQVTMGAVCTAMAAHRLIDSDVPLIFADADNFFFESAIPKFVKDAQMRGLEGSLLTTSSDNPAFSYVRLDKFGYALETREKLVISSHAICGAYYFSRGSMFVDAAIKMMMYGDLQRNEYYISNIYNYLIREGRKVGVFDIPANHFACLGTPEQLTFYLNNR
jgi:dTDP-glucose pyrophosphorylase